MCLRFGLFAEHRAQPFEGILGGGDAFHGLGDLGRLSRLSLRVGIGGLGIEAGTAAVYSGQAPTTLSECPLSSVQLRSEPFPELCADAGCLLERDGQATASLRKSV